MKVALLTDCYLPRLGGIEVQTHDLAAHVAARGHVVEDVDGIPVHRMAIRLPFELPVNPLAPREVRHRLATGGFDVAHVHMGVVSPFATDMVRVALGLGMPTAITWHCLMERSAPVFRLLGQARRWGARGAALSAVSSVAAANVASVVGRQTPVHVFPNGIDVDHWRAPDRPHPPASGGPVRVVAAMRLTARKRPRAVLEVAQRARELAPREAAMRLTLFGDGPDRGRLERFVRRHDMGDWVSLPGRVSRDELRAAYWASDVYLTPARLEAFGIAALEARTAGLPVLARRDTGVGDFVVDSVGGVLCDDDEALARALAELVTEPGRRLAIARTNRTVAPDQAWPAVAALAEAEYRRAGAA